MKVCLYEPEIAGNTGSIARLCACFGVELHIIEPAAFLLDDKKLRRAGLDYMAKANIKLHGSFDDFKSTQHTERIILLDTKATTKYFELQYRETDCIMAGKESTGVPDHIFDACDKRVIIPMLHGMRSINVAMSVAICLSEAIKQTLQNK
jgi:tRNA (cytidine/uridine-2'-O-)-methyltransferase